MGLREILKKRIGHPTLEQRPEMSTPRFRPREFAIFSTILAAFFLFAYRGYFGLGILNQGDLLPLYPKAEYYFNAFFSSWSNSNLGFAGSATEDGFFNALMLIVLGNDPLLAQKITFLAPMLLACLAMFIFLSYHLTLGFEKSLIAFVYGVNPITIGLFFGGGVGLLIYYSVFPILLLFLFNFLEGHKDSSRSVVAFAAVLALAASYDVQASLFALLFAVAFLISKLVSVRNLRNSLKIGASFLASFAVFSVLTLPTTSAYLGSLSGYFFGSAQGTIVHYSATPISHDTLISRIHDDFGFQTYDFLTNAIILTSILTVTTLFIRDTRRLRYALTLLLLLVAGIVFWQMSINGSGLWLYNALPLLFALSTLKLKILFVQAFVLLGAFSLEEARDRGLFGMDSARELEDQITH